MVGKSKEEREIDSGKRGCIMAKPSSRSMDRAHPNLETHSEKDSREVTQYSGPNLTRSPGCREVSMT